MLSRAVNYATLSLALTVFVLVTILPTWLAPIVALSVLMVGGWLIEHFFLGRK